MPPVERLCPKCAAWLCRADDAWCGYCGASCAQLELKVTPSVLQLGDQPPSLYFKLSNPTCASIDVMRIDKPAWMTFPAKPLSRVDPAGSLGFLVQANIESLREPEAAQVVLGTSAGEVSALVMAIAERPVLVCNPARIDAWAAGAGNRSRSTVSVAPKLGRLKVRDVRLLDIPGEVATDRLGAGVAASVDAGAAVDIAIDASRLPRGVRGARLEVDFDGPHGLDTATVPLEVNVRKPPQLRWAGENERPQTRYQTDRQSLKFAFSNQAPDGHDGGVENADLVIQAIEVSAPPGLGGAVRRVSGLPATVAGGDLHTAEFELNLKALEGQKARFLDFGLIVHTNVDGQFNTPTLKRTISVRVEPLPIFEGVVSIDFGTSNTCCAVMPLGGEPELLPLDEQSLVSPTAVQYIDLTKAPPIIETGLRVKNRAAESEEVAASVADGLKRKLRDRRQEIDIRPMIPKRWMTRTASEATSDYLRSIRQIAEHRKSAIFREFILTHPARCPHRQHRRLRKALDEAFGAGRNKVSYLPEPIAALVPSIVERGQRPDGQSYTVASFDLGGGTTDVAMIRVDYEDRTAESVKVKLSILYCKGVDFGGEDLTDYVKSKLTLACTEFLRIQDPGATLVADHVSGAAALDVRRNRAALRDAAERFKASLSNEGAVREPSLLLLRVKQEDGRTVDYPFDFKTVSTHGSLGLAEDFQDYTRKRVFEVGGLLKDAINARQISPDIIQLSGKTSFLDVVHQAIHEMFPRVRIERAAEPKECVVKGACLSRSMSLGKVRIELADSSQRMTSTIGIFPLASSRFLPVLAADATIPHQGLASEVQDCWDGKEPVVLWESMEGADRIIEYSSAGKLLERLGIWEPDERLDLAGERRWPLRIAIKDFDLAVEAISPNGKSIRFYPINRAGE